MGGETVCSEVEIRREGRIAVVQGVLEISPSLSSL